MLLLALAMAATMADTPATSQSPASQPSAPAASKPADAADDPNKVICRREEVTGSHFERRVCMTRAQWDQQTRAAQRLEQQIHEAPAAGPGGPPT